MGLKFEVSDIVINTRYDVNYIVTEIVSAQTKSHLFSKIRGDRCYKIESLMLKQPKTMYIYSFEDHLYRKSTDEDIVSELDYNTGVFVLSNDLTLSAQEDGLYIQNMMGNIYLYKDELYDVLNKLKQLYVF